MAGGRGGLGRFAEADGEPGMAMGKMKSGHNGFSGDPLDSDDSLQIAPSQKVQSVTTATPQLVEQACSTLNAAKTSGMVRRVVFFLLKISVLSALYVAVWILGKNAIGTNCYGVPNFYWLCIWDFLLMGIPAGTFAAWGLPGVFVRPEICFTGRQSAFLCLFMTGNFIILPLLALAGMKDPTKFVALRGLGAVAFVVAMVIMMHRRGKTVPVPFRVDSRPFRRQNAQIAWLFAKWGVTFFVGFYFALMFATQFFGSAMEKVEGKPWYIVMAAEVILVIFFYSLFFPCWSKVLCAVSTEICKLYAISGTMDSRILDSVIVCINFLLDVVRYVYGRGVLFKLSSFVVFFMLLLKDICYQIWHFGLKYMEWVLVFTIKVFHPDGLGDVHPGWLYMSRTVEFVVYFAGIPKYLGSCWEVLCDFTEVSVEEDEEVDDWGPAPKAPEASGIGLKLSFCNMTIKVHNLPETIKPEIQEMKETTKTVEVYEEKDEYGMGGKKGPGRGGLQNANSGPETHAPGSPSAGRSHHDDKGRRRTPPGVGTILDPIMEEAVSYGEMERLRFVMSFIQTHIFMRYQMRACAKLFTSIIFLLIPMLGWCMRGVTSSPGFRDYIDVEAGVPTPQYLVCGLSYFIVDIAEWAFMIRLATLKARDVVSYAGYFHALLTSNYKVKILMVCMSAFFGIFLWHNVLSIFTADGVERINEVRRLNDPSAVVFDDWEDVYEQCWDK